MRAVIQRVTEADVSVEGKITGAIGPGLMVLLGVEEGDSEKDAEYIAEKTAGLRIFEDECGKMNLSVSDIDGKILAVSQFTILGDARKGKRPSFIREKGIETQEGVFQAEMMVRIHNDGPVTILLDSRKLF